MGDSWLISIDPGIADLGVAVFKNGTLVYAKHVRPVSDKVADNKDANMLRMSLALTQELQDLEEAEIITKGADDKIQVVAELAKAGSFMATFLRMAFVVGVVVGRYGRKAQYLLPQASQWKISKPKEPSHDYFMKGLKKKELEVIRTGTEGLKKPERYDVYDAVCIGRWYLEQQQ